MRLRERRRPPSLPCSGREGGLGGREGSLRRFLHLAAAQRRWLCGATSLVLVPGLAALPIGLAWLARAQILTAEHLLRGLLQCDERYLPLWALVAGSVAWSDAEAEHRPLLFAWPVRAWELALAKLVAVGLGYFLLAGAAALGLPALFTQATGEGFPSAVPAGLLLQRALLPGALLLALAGTGGALGSPSAGLALGAALWFLNLLEPTAFWLDRHTAGALHLFAWTRGSTASLQALNLRQAIAALGLGGVALVAAGAARLLRQRWRTGRWGCLR